MAAGEYHNLREAGQEIDGAAVGALLRRDIERQLHFIQSLFEVDDRYSTNHGITLIAQDVRVMSPNNAKQAAAAFRVAEVRVREDNRHDRLGIHIFSVGGRQGSRRWIL